MRRGGLHRGESAGPPGPGLVRIAAETGGDGGVPGQSAERPPDAQDTGESAEEEPGLSVTFLSD